MAEEKEDDLLILVCKFLGYTVVLNTFVDKIPQFYNIVSSRSTAGISMFSVVTEMCAYTSMLTYQYAMGYPFHTFMENVFMVIQDWNLLTLLLYYRRLLKLDIIPFVIIYFIAFTSVGLYWLPDVAMMAVVYFTTPLLCWSKMRQLVEILVHRDPGQLSSITWTMVCYDTAVRMFTTAMITKDVPMFVNLASSEVLNLSILFSIFYYNYTKRRTTRRSSSRDR